jgi:hypothetical protein
MITLGVVDVLKLYRFEPEKTRAKILRHKDKKFPVEELIRTGWYELYQAYQAEPRYDNCDAIVSFYGIEGSRACFYGVYRVLERLPAKKGPSPKECPWVSDWRSGSDCFYRLERDQRFDALKDRLIISWDSPLSWHQHLTNKPVLELLADGRKLPVFDDYLEFSLSYHQLKDLFHTKNAHRDWQSALEAVAGVYLVLAEKSGHQYVGSAYGAYGIWGRWEQYAKTGHGYNKKLIDLVESGKGYPEKFRFSILQILPKSLTKDEVIRREVLYKDKLGSKATGLNSN